MLTETDLRVMLICGINGYAAVQASIKWIPQDLDSVSIPSICPFSVLPLTS